MRAHHPGGLLGQQLALRELPGAVRAVAPHDEEERVLQAAFHRPAVVPQVCAQQEGSAHSRAGTRRRSCSSSRRRRLLTGLGGPGGGLEGHGLQDLLVGLPATERHGNSGGKKASGHSPGCCLGIFWRPSPSPGRPATACTRPHIRYFEVRTRQWSENSPLVSWSRSSPARSSCRSPSSPDPW